MFFVVGLEGSSSGFEDVVEEASSDMMENPHSEVLSNSDRLLQASPHASPYYFCFGVKFVNDQK